MCVTKKKNDQANRWEAAHKLASSYMSEGEVRVLYMEQAQKMEAAGSLLEAEKLYVPVGEVCATSAETIHHSLLLPKVRSFSLSFLCFSWKG